MKKKIFKGIVVLRKHEETERSVKEIVVLKNYTILDISKAAAMRTLQRTKYRESFPESDYDLLLEDVSQVPASALKKAGYKRTVKKSKP